MTKIKMLNDRIIFDGHADSRQECETITLMCDNLAKSKDFKTVRYESGYAEFEKVGKTEELKFVSEPMNCTINFDSHVTKVEVTNEYDETYTWTTSGQTFLINGNSPTTYIFTVTLENGFEINTVQATEAEQYEILSFSNNQITAKTYSSGIGSGFTITTKDAASGLKQVIDVSELPGWAVIATGNHQITIKTKASGYVDSAMSNAVTVAKAASGHKLTITTSLASGIGADLVYMVNGEEHTSGEGFGDDPSGTYVYENVSTFQFDIDCGTVPSIGGIWSIVSTQLGINLIDQAVKPNIAYSSATFTLTEDTVVTYTTATGHSVAGYSVSVERYETYDEQSYEYSTDNGVTWNAITGEGLIVESATQIKFRVTGTAKLAEASINSLLLDMAIVFSSPGHSVGTWVYSENYTLTQNIDDIVCIPSL